MRGRSRLSCKVPAAKKGKSNNPLHVRSARMKVAILTLEQKITPSLQPQSNHDSGICQRYSTALNMTSCSLFDGGETQIPCHRAYHPPLSSRCSTCLKMAGKMGSVRSLHGTHPQQVNSVTSGATSVVTTTTQEVGGEAIILLRTFSIKTVTYPFSLTDHHLLVRPYSLTGWDPVPWWYLSVERQIAPASSRTYFMKPWEKDSNEWIEDRLEKGNEQYTVLVR